jgi:hypothetical protein
LGSIEKEKSNVELLGAAMWNVIGRHEDDEREVDTMQMGY